jgi:hypothetical protein
MVSKWPFNYCGEMGEGQCFLPSPTLLSADRLQALFF